MRARSDDGFTLIPTDGSLRELCGVGPAASGPHVTGYLGGRLQRRPLEPPRDCDGCVDELLAESVERVVAMPRQRDHALRDTRIELQRGQLLRQLEGERRQQADA